MVTQIVKPRTVKKFLVVFKLLVTDEYSDESFEDECDGYAEVRHIANNVYMVKLYCEDPIDTYYIVANSLDEIDVDVVRWLAKETCDDWSDCLDIVEVREVEMSEPPTPRGEEGSP